MLTFSCNFFEGFCGGAENAGVENAGVENAAVDSKGGKCRSGKCRSDNVWKAVRRSYSTQYLTKSPLFSAKTSRRTYIKTGNINALFNALYCCNNTRTVSRSVNIAHER